MIAGSPYNTIQICLVLEAHAAVNMGGAEYQADQLAAELARREGVRVTYLARLVPREWAGAYALQRVGDARGWRRRSVAFDAPMLWRTLQELKPDVIYQRMKQSYTAVCAKYAGQAGIPMVFHVASDPDADGRWFRRPVSPNTPFDLLDVAAGNWGVRRATHVIVQTDSQGQLLRNSFGRAPRAVIRNFQPLPNTLPQKSTQGYRVLWVGNLKEVKRPWLFLELAERLGVSSGTEFWMVGRSATHRSMRSTMAAIAAAKNIRYFGELTLEEVNKLMCQADVFVNTSSFEGSPNTFIQAWARGAVVTSLGVDIDGGMETLGIGYRERDVAALTARIESLRSCPEIRHKVARKAFDYVWREHSTSNMKYLADLLVAVGRGRDDG